MKPYQILSPNRNELTVLASACTFLLKRCGENEIPACMSTAKQLSGCLEEPWRIRLLICDVTVPGVIPVLEQLREANPRMKLILIADGTIPPIRYIRPTILPTALLWKPLQPGDTRDILWEVLSSLSKESTQTEGPENECFAVEVRGDMHHIPFRDILYFEASNKRLNLHTHRKEIAFGGTLEHLEETLPEAFLRVHKSFIVNRGAVSQIQFGQNLVILEDGSNIPISRSYKPAVKAVFV